jgi:hypothetical protein
MARAIQSRNLKGFRWLTKSRVTYHRDVAKERRELKRQAIEERKERIALKKLEAEERAADAKIAAASRKIEAAGKKTDTGSMSEARFEAMKTRMESEIAKQEEYKAAARARAGNPCAQTRKSQVSDRAKRYRANQPGCKPRGVKKCKLCGRKSDLMVDHIDGDESNGRKRNLRWLCRSCNTKLGADMARTGAGRRTVQYNPAVSDFEAGAEAAGMYTRINVRPDRQSFLAAFNQWKRAHGKDASLAQFTAGFKSAAPAHWSNPGAETFGQYARAVAIHESHYVKGKRGRPGHRVGAHDEGGAIIHDTPKWKRQEYAQEIWGSRRAKGNPAVSPEQYRLAQAVLSGTARQTHMSPEAAREIIDRTPARLRSEYSRRNPDSKETSPEYQLGYSLGQRDRETATLPRTWAELEATFDAKFDPTRANALWFFEAYKAGYDPTGGTEAGNPRRQVNRGSSRNNPEPADDGSEEYQQALRTAELFHGRPVKEEIEVKESIRTHDWYVSIGPLIKLVIKPVTKKPKARVPLPFHQSETGQVQLFCSPDGKQFYLRGGDQELDLDAFGMGPGSAWYRDHMLIGEAVEITYRDRKKFHSFKLTDYYHKLGEDTRVKPTLAYDSLANKLSIIGGQYRIEMEDLVDGMSPGIVN